MLYQLFISFSKIGLFSLGGGTTLIKLIEEEFVHHLHLLNPREYGEFVGLSFAFPGFSAVKIAALIGQKVGGWGGVLISVFALNVPGIVLCLLFYGILSRYQHHSLVQKTFDGLRYVAVVCIFSAGFSLVSPLIPSLSVKSALFCVTALFLLTYFNLSLILVILLFLLGWVII